MPTPQPVSRRPSTRRWTQFSLRSFLAVAVLTAVGAAIYVRWNEEPIEKRFGPVAVKWDVRSGENVLWSAPLGSQTYGTPVVSGGRVFIGTNNGHGYLKRYPPKVDLGVLLCFDAGSGKFLWQASFTKLPTGRIHDWPFQGLPSRPHVEGNRLWCVTNQCRVVCLDTDGFYDNQNDGPLVNEPNRNRDEADLVWEFDMIARLGVSPHCISASSVAVDRRRVFVVTGNGVGPAHQKPPAPIAPSFVCLDKRTGKLLWSDSSPGNNVLHGQWGSPVHAVLGGVPQVLMPGGDGWLYSFAPAGDGRGGSRLLWKFDCNPKASQWILGGRGTRNNLIAAPRVYQGRVYIAVGQDPEHGEGPGHLWCIDPTKRGDVSDELVVDANGRAVSHRRLTAVDPAQSERVVSNPNSALIWHYQQGDTNGDGSLAYHESFHRSLCVPAIQDQLLLATDTAGVLHCLDATTGKAYWQFDLLAAAYASPVIAGDHVYVADEDGDVAIFRLDKDPKVAMNGRVPIAEWTMDSAVYGTPTPVSGTLYIASKQRLWAIRKGKSPLAK